MFANSNGDIQATYFTNIKNQSGVEYIKVKGSIVDHVHSTAHEGRVIPT